MMLEKEFKEEYNKLQAERDAINNKISELVNRYHEEVLGRNGYKIGDIISESDIKYKITGIINSGNVLYIKGLNKGKENILRIKLIEI